MLQAPRAAGDDVDLREDVHTADDLTYCAETAQNAVPTSRYKRLTYNANGK